MNKLTNKLFLLLRVEHQLVVMSDTLGSLRHHSNSNSYCFILSPVKLSAHVPYRLAVAVCTSCQVANVRKDVTRNRVHLRSTKVNLHRI